MKIQVKKIGNTPRGWQKSLNAKEVIGHLKSGQVDELDVGTDTAETSLEVLSWIQSAVEKERFKPPVLRVHEARGPHRMRMVNAIRNVQKTSSLPQRV